LHPLAFFRAPTRNAPPEVRNSFSLPAFALSVRLLQRVGGEMPEVAQATDAAVFAQADEDPWPGLVK
jgi:hypothetical protein